MLVNLNKFIIELWPSIHFLLIARMNGWNLTKFVINMCILMCYNMGLDGNGTGQGHLCHIDTFLVFTTSGLSTI